VAKIYLSVPITTSDEQSEPARMPAKDFERQSRMGDAFRVLVGRKELEADPQKLQEQISGQIEVVRAAIKGAEKDDEPIKIQSVKLGLTVTVGGNIGLASAEAEASIEILFARKA
jgi:hypothetical protein